MTAATAPVLTSSSVLVAASSNVTSNRTTSPQKRPELTSSPMVTHLNTSFPLTPHASSVEALSAPERESRPCMYSHFARPTPKCFAGSSLLFRHQITLLLGRNVKGSKKQKTPERQRSPRLTIVQPWTSSQLSPVSPRCASLQHPPWPGHFFSKTSNPDPAILFPATQTQKRTDASRQLPPCPQ